MIAVAGGTRVQITIARHIENVHSVDNPRMALFDGAAGGGKRLVRSVTFS
jgi:hypothetical protein